MPDDMYFGIRSLIAETDIGSRFDIILVDMTNLEEVERVVKSKPAGLI